MEHREILHKQYAAKSGLSRYVRFILTAVFSVSPLIMLADEPDYTPGTNRISWAVMPQFDLNLAGNWKTLKPTEKTIISYGGGIGASCRIHLRSNWLFDTGISICYDNLHISAPELSTSSLNLERWSVPLSVSLGHSFKITQEMDIVPLAGAECSYIFRNKTNDRNAYTNYDWNQLNVSWGIGCGLHLNDRYEIDAVGYFGIPHLIRHSNINLYDNRIRMSFKYFF